MTRPTPERWASPAIVLAILALAACQGETPAPLPKTPASTASAPTSAGTPASTAAPTTAAPKPGQVLPANTIDAQGIQSARIAPIKLGPEGPMTARSTSPVLKICAALSPRSR